MIREDSVQSGTDPVHPGATEREASQDWPQRMLLTLIRKRRVLVFYPLIAAIVVVLISFLFPNYYQSTVVILPPERDFQSADLTSREFGLLASGGLALPITATPSDILQAVVLSRTVRDSVVATLDLRTRWGVEDASSRLGTLIGATVEPTGIVNVWAIDTDRYFSDTLVNTLVGKADRVNRMIVNTKARRTREFVEGRLTDTKADLREAEDALESFQQEHRTVGLDAQITALVQNAAQLQAQITADEIELSVLEGSLSPEHPRVRNLQARIRESQRRLERLQTASPDDTTAALRTGLKNLPKLVQELAEIMRNREVAENLFKLLTEQYETARIQEQRDTPSFSVLDRAQGGGTKVRPRRALIGLATLVVSFCLVLAITVARTYFAELPVRNPAKHRMVTEARTAWRQSKRRDRRSG
jgi:tyrosine-protein kinase Etk/Wzc